MKRMKLAMNKIIDYAINFTITYVLNSEYYICICKYVYMMNIACIYDRVAS